MTIQAKNVADLYRIASQVYAQQPSFLTREKEGDYTGPTYHELYEMGLNLATGLIDLGILPREHIAVLADNCLEWMVVNYACQICGVADVPRSTDVTNEDVQYILSHSDAIAVFVENKKMVDMVAKNKASFPKIKHVILMDKNATAEGGVLSMATLAEKGKELRNSGNRRAEENMQKIKAADLSTLIYTSGTTGVPKGVMLTHSNIISQVNNLPIKLRPQRERMLSILPVWHIFERIFEMISIGLGGTTYYTNIRNIRDDMAKVRPTFMASAPRLWESIYLGLMKKVQNGPVVAFKLFQAAYFLAHNFKASLYFLRGQQLDITGRSFLASLFVRAPLHLLRALLFFLPYLLLDFIVLRKVRKALGGTLKYSVSGGGALPLHVDLFFNNIGVKVLEGYGMTETAPVLALRTPKKLIIGSVGPIWPNTEISLMDLNTNTIISPNMRGIKGEIHAKGPQVMRGYYKNEEATKKVLQDDWMNTGDLGMITYNNTLKIVGRSKETIVLLSGENIEPVPIENKLLQSKYIEQCMVVGQDQRHLCALVVPMLDTLEEHGKSLAALAENKEVEKLIHKSIKELLTLQNGFKSFERVIDFHILAKPFEVGDELTNIFKLKRHIITDKYKDEIASMYV